MTLLFVCDAGGEFESFAPVRVCICLLDGCRVVVVGLSPFLSFWVAGNEQEHRTAFR